MDSKMDTSDAPRKVKVEQGLKSAIQNVAGKLEPMQISNGKKSNADDEKAGEDAEVDILEPIFFKLNNTLNKDVINEYRLKYREFRRGKAFGAHGEIGKQTIVVSEPVETVVPPFIAKLHSMLSNNMYQEYVAWDDDGKNVVVKKVTEFSSVILPKYFKHKNFTSFLRQLNMYGFHTSRQGRNWREFRNELFTKDAPHQHCKIKRRKGEEKASDKAKAADKTRKRRKLENEESIKGMGSLHRQVTENNERMDMIEKKISEMHEMILTLKQVLEGNGKRPLKKKQSRGKTPMIRVPSSPGLSHSDLGSMYSDFMGHDPDDSRGVMRSSREDSREGRWVFSESARSSSGKSHGSRGGFRGQGQGGQEMGYYERDFNSAEHAGATHGYIDDMDRIFNFSDVP